MRRHKALIPLTHDHHHALARARRMRLAAEGEDVAERLDAAREFLGFYDEHTLVHFREEEEVLFPLVIEAADAPMDLLTRILVEHVRIHALVQRLRNEVAAGEPEAGTLADLGETLKGHIRLEEDELFPAIEALVADAELEALTFAERERTPPPRPGR